MCNGYMADEVYTYVMYYTVGHKKTHQKCFYHNFRKTKPI